MERHDPRPELQLAKITFDALGLIPLADSEIAVRTLRPGRTIEQVEATMSVSGRVVVRATAWRLLRQDTSAVAGGAPAPLPTAESMTPWEGSDRWFGGYIESLEFRRAPESRPGAGRAWIRTDVALVDGEPVSDAAAFFALVDTANGVAVRADPREWMFPNVDLTVHLFREPVAGWVGLDTEVLFGATGLGITSSTVHDARGPVGRAEQSLTVRPVPAAAR
jgi:hypothetical protein